MYTQTSLKGVMDVEIEKLLKDVAEEEGFFDYKIGKTPGSAEGDGNFGIISSIRITGTGKSNNDQQELNLIMKRASKSEALRAEAPISNIFRREIHMYDVVIPAFQHFEIQRGLPPFSGSAKCYKTCLTDKNEALIMEDLKIRGYCVWDSRKPLEHEHIAMVMKECGRFYALSFALRDQELEIFEKVTKPMDNVFKEFLEKSDVLKMNKDRCEKAALESLDPETDKKAFEAFKKFIDDDLEGFIKGLHVLTNKFFAIVHGDFWTNNMMFKYDDEENRTKPTQMCFIDFQFSNIGSPVLDLSVFLYACSSKAAITNIEEYLNIYYNTLSSYLKLLGSNSDEVYPYSVFRQQWKDLSKFGLICSMLIIHIMLSEQNEAPDLSDVADSGSSITNAFNYIICNAEVYNDRVRHVILHFVENNLI